MHERSWNKLILFGSSNIPTQYLYFPILVFVGNEVQQLSKNQKTLFFESRMFLRFAKINIATK